MENLMNFKIIADYAFQEQEKLGKLSGGSMKEYRKSILRYKIAHQRFLDEMNKFSENNKIGKPSIKFKI